MIAIRRAADADRLAIATLHEASIRRLTTAHYTPEQIESWVGVLRPERYPLDTSFFVVAVDDERVVGFGEYHDAEIAAVYIHPPHVGRGIGRMIFDALENEARGSGATSLHVTSSLNAVAFYEACGFQREGEATYTSRGGREIPCRRLTKQLSSRA